MHRLLEIYILGYIFGIISEFTISRFNHYCIKNFRYGCLISFNIYGIGLVLITIFLDYAKRHNLNIIMTIMMLAILLSLYECISGKISYIVQKKKTWNYKIYPICDGFVSLPTTIYFMIFTFLYIKFIYPHFPK